MLRKKPKLRVADNKQVFDYACWLLARRNYSSLELLKKFHSRFKPAPAIFETTLKKLQTLRFQSDADFAQNFVEQHVDWGRYRLELELSRRGITPELIVTVLPQSEDEVGRCREILRLRLRGLPLPQDWKEKQKLLAFLTRRGFDLEVARKIIEF